MLNETQRYTWSNGRSYGEDTPQEAANDERHDLRKSRLADALGGKDVKLEIATIARSFDRIVAAIKAADDQFFSDNKEFLARHGIAPSASSEG